ncbi:MAG TPA: hypothetical protein VK563_22575 [Puia sp.]|nr:hypothetical protein [Puia sp.]
MKRMFSIVAGILLCCGSYAQKMYYSDPEKEDFDRFRFDVIAHQQDRIIVYKAVYFGSPFSTARAYQGPGNSYANPGTVSGPAASILESTICIYDPSMKLLDKLLLPVPKEISGVHFLVYEGFFYMFYQYQKGHTIYCMAAKIGMDGKLTGPPLELDHTDIVDIHYQSQIYSVIYSEDKRRILVFNEDGHYEEKNIINSLLFDQDLHLIRRSAHALNMEGSEYLTEFRIDNEGNFVFLGNSQDLKVNNEHRAIIFTLGAKDDSLTFHYYVPAALFVDGGRLLIDNLHKRYIILSAYSLAAQGDVEGLFCVIRNAEGDNDVVVTKTILSDSVRRQLKAKGNLRKVFNDFYVQDLHLRKDGGFEAEIENLGHSPDWKYFDRWNYLRSFSEQVASNYVFYDPYENDHYYPWRTWKGSGGGGSGVSFYSQTTMILSFDADGVVEWISVVNMPQFDQYHAAIGYKTFVYHDLIYLLYNVTIRKKRHLTAQSINGTGQLNTDTRLKEDMEFKDANEDYIFFPRLARMVGSGELIMPCRNGAMISLARVQF